jgi:hypothetical protein
MDTFRFTGIVLLSLIILIIVINFIIKYRNKKKGVTNNDFMFSPEVARTMRVIDIGIQYESTIVALSFLMTGMLLFTIYIIFFAPYTLIMKFFVVFNSLCGFVLMGSMLVTAYQQFVSYKESTSAISDLANQFGTEILSPDKLKSGTILTPLKDEENVVDKVFDNFKNNERRITD